MSEKLLRCCVCVCGKAHCSFILILSKALLEWVMQEFKRKEGECRFIKFCVSELCILVLHCYFVKSIA